MLNNIIVFQFSILGIKNYEIRNFTRIEGFLGLTDFNKSVNPNNPSIRVK